MLRRISLLLFLAVLAASAEAAETAANADLNRIVDEGLNRSHATLIAQYLDDVIGARLTNSPQMRQAEVWTMQQFSSWGLANVHKEPFDFGRGWYVVSSSVRMTAPRNLALTAVPIAWSPPTPGAVSAEITVAPMQSDADFTRWRGKLKGKIVLTDPAGAVRQITTPLFTRITPEDIARREIFRPGGFTPEARRAASEKVAFSRAVDLFLKEEGAVARVQKSEIDYKLVRGVGLSYRASDQPAVPSIEMAAEDYRRLVRLAALGQPPVLNIDNDVRFDDSDHDANNIFAEIPGSDRNGGYILLGAHLDSWAAGDGAMDDGGGVTTVMEAARILATLHIRPKRTIRFVLWAGEEQGALGSMAFTNKHLATINLPSEGKELNGIQENLLLDHATVSHLQPGYSDLKAYFNLDGGGGRIRGLSAQGNIAAIPLIHEWLAPFASFGATTVSPITLGGDNSSMTAVGAPTLNFSSDGLDALTIYHTNADTLDHLIADDSRQAAIVVAGVVLNAANSEAMLPRMPVPAPGLETQSVIP